MNLLNRRVFLQAISTTQASDTWAHARVPEGMEWRDIVAQDSQGAQFPAVHHGKDLFIRCPMSASNSSIGERKELTLVANPDALEIDGASSETQGGDKRIRISEWVSDRFQDLVPVVQAQYQGSIITAPVPVIQSIEESPVRLRVHLYTKFDETPLMVHMWMDIFDSQEIVELYGTVSWGAVDDGLNTAYTDDINFVRLAFRENWHIDWGQNKGLPSQPWQGTNGWTNYVARPSQWLSNRWYRSCAVRFTGALLCLPTDPSQAAGDPRVQNLEHRKDGKVYAQLSKEDWEGHYGPLGHIPYIQNAGARDAAMQMLRNEYLPYRTTFWGEDKTDMFLNRPVSPNGQGGQDDHGAVGNPFGMSTDSPDALFCLSRMVDTHYRYISMILYQSGHTVVGENHPGAYFFEDEPWELPPQSPLYQSGVSGDKLGWPEWFTRTAQHEYMRPLIYNTGYNASHYSFGNLLSFYELTGDPSVAKLLETRAFIFEKNNNWPPRSGWNKLEPALQYVGVGHTGASYTAETNAQTRGFGRATHVAAWLWHLGFRRKSLRDEINSALDWVLWADAGNDPALANKPMKPFDWKDYSYGFNHTCVKSWMHSLLMLGLWSCIEVPGILTEERKADLQARCDRAAETVIEYLIPYNNSTGQYEWIQHYIWNYGDPYPLSTIFAPNQTVVTFYSGFWMDVMLRYMADRGNTKARQIVDTWETASYQKAQQATGRLLP